MAVNSAMFPAVVDALSLKLESDDTMFARQTGLRAQLTHRLPPPSRCEHCCRAGHPADTCIARTEAVSETDVGSIRCITCHRPGHTTCHQFDAQVRSAFCCKCGEKGHFGSECGAGRARQKTTFNRNVRDLMHRVRANESDSDSDRPRTGREKRYWEKITNKAFKKAKRLQKEQRSRSR